MDFLRAIPAFLLVLGESCLVTPESNQDVAGGAWIQKTLDDIVFDEGNNFDTALSKYTVPVDGQYLVLTFATMNAPFNGHYPSTRLYKNGTYFTRDSDDDLYARVAGRDSIIVSRLLTLTKDDYLQLYVSNNGAESKVWSFGLIECYMLVIRLS